MFPVTASAQGFLCVVGHLVLRPEVCQRRVGGFFYRQKAHLVKNAILSDLGRRISKRYEYSGLRINWLDLDDLEGPQTLQGATDTVVCA